MTYNNITEEMIKIKEKCFVNQTSCNDCGLACLSMILKHHGINVSLDDLKADFKKGDEKASVYDIIKLSSKYNVDASGYKNVVIDNANLPCIAHVIDDDKQHFVVVAKVLKDKVLIFDPARKIMNIQKTDFLKKYTGVVIMFEKKNNLIKDVLKNKKMIFKTLVFSFVITLLSVLFSFMIPVIIGKINEGAKLIVIFLFILFFLLVGVLKDVVNYFKSVLLVKFQLFIDKFITIPTINKIISLPHVFYHSNGSGELIAKINDLSYIKDAIFSFVDVVIVNVLLVIFSLFVMMISDFTAFFVNVILVVISCLINRTFIRNNLSKSYDLQRLNEKLSNKLTDVFSAILTIKNLVKEKYFKNKIKVLYDEVLNKYNSFSISYQKVELQISILFTLFTILTFSLLVFKGASLSRILLFVSIESTLTAALLQLHKLLPLYADFRNVYARVNEIFKQKELRETKEAIDINRVYINKLKYNYNNKKVLNNVFLEIKKGDWIMVNGPSGSGKTTLFKLLTKQIPYFGNSVFINGRNIKNIDEEIIRNSVCYVDQKIKLINESIKENIFLDDFYDDKVISTSLVKDMLLEKNIDYDYVIDNTNSNISAGQIGKIAIAQALNTNKDFIIFDETTSSMDILSEKTVLENIKQNYNGKTIVLITHRRSNVKYFNKIITFKNGKIIKLQGGKNEKIIKQRS